MVTLAASFVVSILQCSTNESLNSFNGRMETVSAPIERAHLFRPYNYRMRTDSIRWVNEFPSEGPSRVTIILSGQIQTDSLDPTDNPINIPIGQNHLDLGVETYTGSVPGIVPLAFDSVGGFLDTLLIAASPLSGFILHESSRLFVKKVIDTSTTIMFDTIQLVNPHTTGGQP
jgi:hypothetical protein